MSFNGFAVHPVNALSVTVLCCDHAFLVHVEKGRMSVVISSSVLCYMFQPPFATEASDMEIIFNCTLYCISVVFLVEVHLFEMVHQLKNIFYCMYADNSDICSKGTSESTELSLLF